MAWVIDDAPVPPDLAWTLIVIARRCDDSGRGSYQSMATLAAKTGKSEKQARRDVARLLELGLIRSGDQSLPERNGVPLGRRPTVYDVVLDLQGEKPARQSKNPTGLSKEGSTPPMQATPPIQGTPPMHGVPTPPMEGHPTPPMHGSQIKPLKNPKKNPPSPYPLDVAGEVVDAEILEEEEGLTSSLETQMQTLTDEIRTVRPNWAAIDIKTNVTGAMAMLADSFEAAAVVARETAKDPDSARPSRITASLNPHLQAAKAALLIAKADSAGSTAPAIPLHPDAHPFEADGARRECRRCEFPEANARHRIPESARNGSYVANNRRSPNRHVPYRDRPAEAYKTSKI